MEAALFGGYEALWTLLPSSVLRPAAPEELQSVRWALLTLTAAGCAALAASKTICGCGTLLLPGDCAPEALERVRAERAVGYGLSPRDSLTFSSLESSPVLCVQRALLRPDGQTVEPMELPLKNLPELPPGDLLAALGTRLLLETYGI
jgi:hypothetical protein